MSGPGSVADTLLGKRSAFLDLASSGGQASAAPPAGWSRRRGPRLPARRARPLRSGCRATWPLGIRAWSSSTSMPGATSGPWSGRRGFDSIVQAACGIATIESPDGSAPGALPCQLLDHGTGYLAAAAVLDGLRRQAPGGGTIIRSLSLARTAPGSPGAWARIAHGPPAGAEGPRGLDVEAVDPDRLDGRARRPGGLDRPPSLLRGRLRRPIPWSGPSGSGYGARWAGSGSHGRPIRCSLDRRR